MALPSDTALKTRARSLLEAMTERERWVYAVPREPGDKHARPLLLERGLTVQEEDAAAGVVRLVDGRDEARFVLFSSPELEVTMVEASGAAAPPLLAELLDRTGFYAQSQLLKTALDVRDPECVKALRTLAHMVVAWDEDWSDLFLLHLASPDAVVRHEAVASTSIAAMVSRDPPPALRLLEEALRREKFPKLQETMKEAIGVVTAMGGGPVQL
jgi:predicted nuclease of predicted toxin-antitoxin system